MAFKKKEPKFKVGEALALREEMGAIAYRLAERGVVNL